MSGFPDFDLAATPLLCGTTLLEASAGTGKTYAITGIAARLIAVEDIPIREILIVTFTEAAARELRDRVRRRLMEVASALGDDGPQEDAAAIGIRASGVSLEVARRRLAVAVACFDEASISTIHGFCQRMLRDNAFESGMVFEAEVVSDPRDLMLDLAMDFWRTRFYAAPVLAAALAERNELLPEDLAQLLGRLGRHPDLRILPEVTDSFDAATATAVEAYDAALECWCEDCDELVELLMEHPGISRSQRGGLPRPVVAAHIGVLNHAAATGIPTIDSVKALEALTQESFDAMGLKRHEPPEHRMFEACSAFASAMNSWVAAFRRTWLEYAALEFPRLKDARRLMTFDDMLTRMRAALEGPHGNDLANLARERYRAALIDEFQDTDPLQYAIFTRIFEGTQHRLMFVGDPKQSIYGFRGADLFTYLEAKRSIREQPEPQIYTLRQNHRPEAGLVAAVNELFSATPGCFLESDVDFVPSEACSAKAEAHRFSGPEDHSPRALQFVWGPAADPEKGPISKSAAIPLICAHVVREIARLTRGEYRLGERRVGPGDIAALVRNHFQAEQIQTGLRKAGIPSVRHTEDSVFRTREAEELLRVLAAVIEPGRERLLKTALATRIFGLDAAELYRIQSDERAWDARIEQFMDLRSLWKDHGFTNAFRQLLVTEEVRPRLVRYEGGERSLTNLLHLAELVHDAERELRLPAAGLMQWIGHQRDELTTPPEAHFLRLDRDDDAVKIVTLHKAKGLEYGIVFCPFHWVEADARETIFHDPEDDYRLNLDLSEPPPPAHAALAEHEVLAEEIRLLYVGTTRAIHRCYLYGCDTKEPARSPLGRVLGIEGPGADGPTGVPAAVERLVESNPANIGIWRLEQEPVAVAVKDEADGVALELRSRTVDREMPYDGMVASFSGLVASTRGSPQDRDGIEPGPTRRGRQQAKGDYSIFTLPKGAATGNALHSILEKVDFSEPEGLDSAVADALRVGNLDPAFGSAITAQLTRLFSHPLGAGDRTVRLSDVRLSDRLSEVEFFYPIRRFSPEDLARVYRDLQIPGLPERVGRLRFNPVEGHMLGFIDLIFRHGGRYYLADWKSNWLGDAPADYAPERLTAAMVDSSYHLQSHLYAVALDLHLASRLSDYRFADHFGGIFYIFVRGLDSEAPERGVHFESPDEGFLQALKDRILSEPVARP